MRLLSGGSLFLNGSLFNSRSGLLYGSLFLGSRSLGILAATTGSALGLHLFLISLSLSIRSLLIGLLHLTLLDTLRDSGAAGVEDNLNRILSVVVSGNHEINVIGVRVGVYNTEHGDSQTVCLTDGNLLFQYVNHEECARQTSQIGDRT